jgi:hypothetical protein
MSGGFKWALVGVLAVLGIIVAGEWVAGEARLARIAAPAVLPPQAPHPAALVGATAAAPADIDDWVRIALGRPLMDASRRPAARTDDAGVSVANGLPRLSGTVLSDDGGVAIFAREESGHPLVLHQGSTLGPYRILRITADGVTLDGPQGRQTLHPRFGDAQPTQAAPRPLFMPPPMGVLGAMPPMPGLTPPQLDRDPD